VQGGDRVLKPSLELSPRVEICLTTESWLVLQDGSVPGGDTGVAVVDASTTAYLDLTGILDPAKEAAKLQKQQQDVRHVSSDCFPLVALTLSTKEAAKLRNCRGTCIILCNLVQNCCALFGRV